MLDSILKHTVHSQRLPRRLWPIVKAQAECATQSWRQPDQGIGEARGKPQHYVSSKLMGWVAMDRAAVLAAIRGDRELQAKWRATAEEIHADILEHGVSDKGVLRQHYDTDALDASTLLAAIFGFADRGVRADHPRRATGARGTRAAELGGPRSLRPDRTIGDRTVAHYDVIIIGTGAGGGTLARHLARCGKRVLLLERGGWLPREPANVSAEEVFVAGRYVTHDTWRYENGDEFQPDVHYFVGGATKMYGAALYGVGLVSEQKWRVFVSGSSASPGIAGPRRGFLS